LPILPQFADTAPNLPILPQFADTAPICRYCPNLQILPQFADTAPICRYCPNLSKKLVMPFTTHKANYLLLHVVYINRNSEDIKFALSVKVVKFAMFLFVNSRKHVAFTNCFIIITVRK
jgi:hypothetical protein